MGEGAATFLGGVLKRTGLLNDEQIAQALAVARAEGLPVAQVVAREGMAGELEFLEALAAAMRLPFMRLETADIERSVLDRLPTKAVFQYTAIPVAYDAATNVLTVATGDPLNAGLVDALRLACGGRVRLAVCPHAEIAKAVKTLYGVGADTVDRMMQDNRFEVGEAQALGKVDLNELDQETSIVKFVNQIIYEAHLQGATDIHLEPMERQFRIRYRIDGVLHETPVPAQLHRFQAAITSRIKVMANLDIAEKRLPMDGRIGLRVEGQDVDIRVSTMPTTYGESVSLRLLRGSGELIGLSDLGFGEADAVRIRRVIQRPNGIVLVTGPTGSGKSTSLYAFLHEINTMDVRILTAEDPIEYQMPGVNQVLVRPDIGLTFAKVLRSFLRQDPDIIMVGEIRDLETAEIAVQASLTGHLVFSTLHTNDAASAFTRLLDMGVEPYLLASAVEAVVAQRLVRKLCPVCRRPERPPDDFLNEIGFPREAREALRVFTAVGCEKCRKTGFRGRGGIFEVLEADDAIESLVIRRASATEIKQQAVRDGMRTLRDDGWEKVRQGMTTIEEVLRATEENE